VAPLHAVVQLPQLAAFERTSTHAVPQYSWPGGQQLPLLHHSVGAQAFVQLPHSSW
jgi:hypothetical protein